MQLKFNLFQLVQLTCYISICTFGFNSVRNCFLILIFIEFLLSWKIVHFSVNKAEKEKILLEFVSHSFSVFLFLVKFLSGSDMCVLD